MSRLQIFLNKFGTPGYLLLIMKFCTVGQFGVYLNFGLLNLFLLWTNESTAAQYAFLSAGHVVFVCHYFWTYKDSRRNSIVVAYAWFMPFSVGVGSLYRLVFEEVSGIGVWRIAAFGLALGLFVPFTFNWNLWVVFPKHTLPTEHIKALWLRLVDRNKHN